MVLQNLSVVQKLLLAFVTLILGIVFIGVIATNSLGVTQIGDKTESVSIASARNATGGLNSSVGISLATIPAWRIDYNECYPTSIRFYNQTGQLMTAGVDYTFTSPSTLNVNNVANLNKTAAGNTTTAAYAYCQDGYLTQGWGRSVTNLIAGFFALALLGASLGLFYSIAKDTGML